MSHGSEELRSGTKIKASTAAKERGNVTVSFSQVWSYPSGGMVELPLTRRREAKSKDDRHTLAKELSMARVYAKAGGRIIFTPIGEGNHDIFYNGIPAELKRVSSPRQVEHHCRHATKHQGAKVILFEFTHKSPEFHKAINKVKALGFRGKYYFSNERKISDF